MKIPFITAYINKKWSHAFSKLTILILEETSKLAKADKRDDVADWINETIDDYKKVKKLPIDK